MADFAPWFRRQLDRRAWSRSDFAGRASVSARTVTAWYNGERVPDPPSCDVIADVLGLDLDYVLLKAGHRPAIEPEADPAIAEIAAQLRRVRLKRSREDILRDLIRHWLEEDREGMLGAEGAEALSRPA
jgi:transcriptional regulator with XRE-family HTH domain